MNQHGQPKGEAGEENADPSDQAPVGAILITSLLAGVIVTLWFGMYLLNILRG